MLNVKPLNYQKYSFMFAKSSNINKQKNRSKRSYNLDSPLRVGCINNLRRQDMYKIGDFSKISKTTIKALRYYEKEGLLKPTFIDQYTSYRYYESS